MDIRSNPSVHVVQVVQASPRSGSRPAMSPERQDDDREPATTGLPDGAPEPPPLGAPDPDVEETPDTGPEAMPGIPTEGEPPDAG
jgi:hypothetical protein